MSPTSAADAGCCTSSTILAHGQRLAGLGERLGRRHGRVGDFGRRYVLDPVMLPRALARSPRNALDVGCGEGRFCRMLKSRDVAAVGVDPTPALIAVARKRDPRGTYVKATAERLPFRDGAFDLVVSYLSLIDIPDVEPPSLIWLGSQARWHLVDCQSQQLQHGVRGCRLDQGRGRPSRLLSDRPLPARARDVDRVPGHSSGQPPSPLEYVSARTPRRGAGPDPFDEPAASADAPASRAAAYARMPWFLVMEWLKPAAGHRLD